MTTQTYDIAELESIKAANQDKILKTMNRLAKEDRKLASESALMAALMSPNFKPGKRWVTERLNDMQEHEFRMGLIRAFENDPDLFYKLMFVGGMGSVVIGAALGFTMDKNSVAPGLGFAGYVMIPAGLTMSAFAGLMLAFPRVFGPDGIKFEGMLETEGFGGIIGGTSAEVKIG